MKWNVGAEMFFASDRKDDLIIEDPYSIMRITNKSYFDININGLYNLNDKFSVFLNLNNILNSNYYPTISHCLNTSLKFWLSLLQK